MAVTDEMETYAARLASFSKAHPATKKRASDPKGTKTSKWPHKSPTPSQLAQAGFFYRPTSSCPDNATCFLCKSNLNGWEEDDNAVEEHLKFSPTCGWAINISIEQDIESGRPTGRDPMSEEILNARKMTFGIQWPHEGKRGWTCKTQRMINAGWYYCPTPESDDFVKCSYCNLSLDGWEPKDNPFEEHLRRSPDCTFFAYATTTKPKPGRSRKSRTSKASRMSTQSNSTVIMEGPSIAELERNVDNGETMSPIDVFKPVKSANVGKKASKAKRSNAKPKSKRVTAVVEEMAQGSSFVEPEDDDFEVKVDLRNERSMRNKKRKSDEMSLNNEATFTDSPMLEDGEPQPRPAKRRTTSTRSSIAQSASTQVLHHEDNNDTHMTDAEDMPPPSVPIVSRGGGKGRKRASSTVRKASAMSTASMASLRAAVPDDDNLDAALEADLDRPLTDEEAEVESMEIELPKTRRLTRTKPASRNGTASVAPVRRTTRSSTIPIGNSYLEEQGFSMVGIPAPESAVVASPAQDLGRELEALSILPKAKATKKPNSRKASAARPKSIQPSSAVNQEENVGYKPADHEDEELVKSKSSKSRQPSRQVSKHNTRVSEQSAVPDHLDLASSVIGSVTGAGDSGQETDASVVSQGPKKRGRKKCSVAAKKGIAGKKAALMSRKIEDIIQPCTDYAEHAEQEDALSIDHPTNAESKAVDIDLTNDEMKVKKTSKPTKTRLKQPASKKYEQHEPANMDDGSSRAPSLSRPAPSDQTHLIKHVLSSPIESAREVPPPVVEISTETETSQSSTQATPRPVISSQSSDAENQPPSSRPFILRPPLSAQSPFQSQPTCVTLAASTPTTSPSKVKSSKLQSTYPWTAVDIEKFFIGSPTSEKENLPSSLGAVIDGVKGELSSPEKKLTVEEWINFNAKKGEEKLRSECERLVGTFESEGVRALKTLEGIRCVE